MNNVGRVRRNAMKVGLHVHIAEKTTSPAFIRTFHLISKSGKTISYSVAVSSNIEHHRLERGTQIVLDRLIEIQEVQERILQRLDDFDGHENPILSPQSLPMAVEVANVSSGVKSHLNISTPRSPTHAKAASTPDMQAIKLPDDTGKLRNGPAKGRKAAATHTLLQWPVIKQLLSPVVSTGMSIDPLDPNYVMILEESRGPLQPYGRDEGSTHTFATLSTDDSYHSTRNISSRTDDPSIRTTATPSEIPGFSSAFPETDLPRRFLDYGHLVDDAHDDTASLPHIVDRSWFKRGPGNIPWPSLHDFCAFNLNQEVISHYHQVALSSILSGHPILEENALMHTIQSFMKKYYPSESYPRRGRAWDSTFITSMPPSAKRQMSQDDSETGVFDSPSPSRSLSPIPKICKPPVSVSRINRNLDNAIVLLVFALGAICSWKSYGMPGPPQIPAPPLFPSLYAAADDYNDAFDTRSSTSSTSLDSSNMFIESPASTPIRDFGGSKKRKRDTYPPELSSYRSAPRNMDVIPGMAYFAYASDILSSFSGSTSLHYTQACLLAGMYAAQVVHPFTTHAWIQQACRACEVLIQP